jgi:hypothetical protein
MGGTISTFKSNNSFKTTSCDNGNSDNGDGNNNNSPNITEAPPTMKRQLSFEEKIWEKVC